MGVSLFLAPPAPQPSGVMNNGSRDLSRDIQKLQQQLQDIKDQVKSFFFFYYYIDLYLRL